ncbi:MAG TPA: nucleotide exchange factor GrpE [Desulfurivibrionaceae bacterium]|nr:nucleotide exchange factor GrpE [Desulfurivibrionaceae bacterium]
MTDSVNQEGEQPTAVPEGADEQANLVSELDKAREEAKDLQDRLLRLAAEFENFKKRMQRERETAMKYAEEGLLRDLLPSLDNLERAVEQGKTSGDAAGLLEGVEMTLSGLRNTLEKYGLKPVDGAGQPFDPNLHEALAMEASDTVPPNTILQEYQKGYMFKDRLLRAAKVVVAKAGE